MSDLVSPEEVRHIAQLARIDLTEEEVSQFVSECGDIFDYFEMLNSVPEMDDSEEFDNVLRPDDPEPCLSHEEALMNAEETEEGYFKGPRVS